MKKILASMAIGLTLFLSAATIISGLCLMGDYLINGGSRGMQGFELFSLGAILFIVILSGYMLSKILSYTEVMVDTLTTLVDHTISKSGPNPINPLEALFGQMGLPGSGTIKMAKMDEDGNIIPFMSKEFNNKEEFIKHRDEILSKALGGTNKKKVEDMTLEELQVEEKKAVSTQDFELAACIRDAINEKTKNKN